MNIIKSTGTFSFYTLISRISGYFRDILIAIFLGSGVIADATLSITGNVETKNLNLTSSNGGFANTALTFQQRAIPFLCVNYIIAT